MITVAGKLISGLFHEGMQYRDFTLKPLTLRDELKALDDYEKEIGALDDEPKNYRDKALDIIENAAYLAQQITIDNLPIAVTLSVLLDNLTSDDYDILLVMQNELKKKLIADGACKDAQISENSLNQYEAIDTVTNSTDTQV